MIDRITFDPNIMGGRACIRGMRIPVSVIVNLVANGMSKEQIIAEYPDLQEEDIVQALKYTAWLTQDEIHSHASAIQCHPQHAFRKSHRAGRLYK